MNEENYNLVRLQKYLAEQGYGSRRACEKFIAEGLIKINGEVVTKMGTKVDPFVDKVEVDEVLLKKSAGRKRYLMFNKPAGIVTTCAELKTDKTVIDIVNVPERVFPIGRLDKPTTGLLILTNDGQITHELLHPSQNKEKEYVVRVSGFITEGRLDKLRGGVSILGRKTKTTEITNITDHSFHIVLTEGKNRQIRRMCRKVGLRVTDLQRIRINGLRLDPMLGIGKYRDLTKAELKLLKGSSPVLKLRGRLLGED